MGGPTDDKWRDLDGTAAPAEFSDDTLTFEIIGAAQTVHTRLGMGFTEFVYQTALCHELMKRGIPFECQKEYNVYYENLLCGKFRADLVVAGAVILELSSVCHLR